MVTNTRTGQVNDGINTLQRFEVDVARCWIPRRLTRIHSRSPDKSDDGVAVTLETCAQCCANQSRGTGHRNSHDLEP